MKKLNLLWLVLPILILSACDTNQYKDQMHAAPTNQEEIDQNAIINYLVANKVSAERTESGIYYTISNEGEGKNPVAEDIVKVHYKGTLLDSAGTTFDSSYERNEPAVFPLNRVIPGWSEGIPLFKEGGKGTLYIPSGLAYAANPPQGSEIKPNDPLIFDVELLEVMNEESLAKYQEEQIQKQKEAAEKQVIVDEEIISTYVADNKIDAKRTPEGIYYTIEKAGSSKKPTLENKVTVHYTGTLLDGTVFDSSKGGEPVTFPLGGVVRGWQLGIPLFGKGGKGRIIVPSGLSYGPNPRPGGKIKANDVLIFDVELIDIQ